MRLVYAILVLLDREFNHSRKRLEVPIREIYSVYSITLCRVRYNESCLEEISRMRSYANCELPYIEFKVSYGD